MTVDSQQDASFGRISAVATESLADRLGLRPSDELLSINGHLLRDVIDVRYYASEPLLRLQVRREDDVRLLEAERRYDEPLGIEFAEPVFNRIRRCNNRCEFCFVTQMPRGLRPSLYVKDDDYRYSFLFGSYITLSNLTEADWQRIDEQRLSPLYVSVHATEPDLRRHFLGNPDAPDILEQLGRLTEMGILVHTQIVVRAGVNDGSHLDRSIRDLAGLYPAIGSVSIVPVGLTQYHRFDCRLHTETEMRAVLDRVSEWQARLREELGVTFAHLSDEWYRRLGKDVPPIEHYDGLDLTENGVGLVRRFLDREEQALRSQLSDVESPTLVTGTLFAPVLRSAVAGLSADVVAVPNRFFGESVTVAGLLTAQDVIEQLKGQDADRVVVLPAVMFAGPEGQSLDEMWPADVEQALGRPVVVGETSDGARVPMGVAPAR
jgi:putative radical SAM enzyme (TIGR03279 family)